MTDKRDTEFTGKGIFHSAKGTWNVISTCLVPIHLTVDQKYILCTISVVSIFVFRDLILGMKRRSSISRQRPKQSKQWKYVGSSARQQMLFH